MRARFWWGNLKEKGPRRRSRCEDDNVTLLCDIVRESKDWIHSTGAGGQEVNSSEQCKCSVSTGHVFTNCCRTVFIFSQAVVW